MTAFRFAVCRPGLEGWLKEEWAREASDLRPSFQRPGLVTFKVTNRGTLSHDFRIAGKKTPLVPRGKEATLGVRLKKAGEYPFLCTVPGHAAGGMKGTLTVR